MNETCRSCRFWINDEHMSQMCRLNPQHVAHGPNDWCGQYQANKETQEALERERIAEIKIGTADNAPQAAATQEPASQTAAPEGKDTGKAEIAAPEPSQKKMPARRKR